MRCLNLKISAYSATPRFKSDCPIHSVNRYRFLLEARATQNEYRTTLKNWIEWGGGVPIENLNRKEVREVSDWVHERAVSLEGANPSRTSNKARDHLRAIISWPSGIRAAFLYSILVLSAAP